jgi:hypothetical protein
MPVRSLAVCVALLAPTPWVRADRAAAPPPLERALAAPVVVVGKVASIEKETVEAGASPNGPKAHFTIAVVKIEDALVGAKGLTHLKVGFLGGNTSRRAGDSLFLKDGQEACLYLKKHPAGDFYTFDYMSQPLDATAPSFKQEVATAKAALAAVADPLAALKAEKAEARYLAAAGLVTRYRTPVPGGEQLAVPAEERKLIYAALLEQDWSKAETESLQPAGVVSRLRTGEQGSFRPAPFTGAGDYTAHLHAEFQKWVAGDGKAFELKKFVPKTVK